MIEIRNSEQLQRWLLESGHLAPLWDRPRFLFDPEEFERELAGVRVQYPQFTAEEAEARAALRLMGKEEGRGRAIVAGRGGHRRQWTRRERVFLLALVALAAAIALLLCVPRAHAQSRDFGIVAANSHEGFRSALLDPSRGFGLDQGGQPGGIIIQLANSGTVLATTPAGLLQFNCSSGMACSWTAGSGSNPPTFTLTSTGGGGGSVTLETNGTQNTSQTLLNLENSSAFNGLTFTFSNPSGGNVQAGFTGTLNDGGLTSAYSGTGSCAAHNWANAFTRNAAPGCSQPAFSDISGTLAAAQCPSPSASAIGCVESYAAVSHQWINAISTSGVPSSTQPAFSDISGTLAAAQCPSPSASTIGCVESYAAVSHQWISAISTSGAPSSTQPGFSDLSGSIALGQTPLSTAGDTLYVNSTPALARLGIGSNGQCKEVASGLPAWGNCVTSFTGDGALLSNSGSTGAVTATLASAGAHKWWGNSSGSTGAPSYNSLGTGDLPGSGAMTVNGQTCTLGASCNVNAGDTAHTIAVNEGNGSQLNGAGPGTAQQILVSQGASSDPTYIDLPQVEIIPFAACVAGTAGAGVSTASSNFTAACRAGTNNLGAALQQIPSTGASLQFMVELPKDWDTGTQPYIAIYYGSGSNTSGTVIWTVSSACVDVSTNGGASDDPAFQAESAFSSQTMANANRMWFQTGQFTKMTSANGCKASSPVIIKCAVSGTAGSNINAYQAVLTIPRLPAVQAN